MSQPQIGHFDSIAIAAIRPSPTNPRKHFDELAMMDLQRSIEEMGVQQPLLLRVQSATINKSSAAGKTETTSGAEYVYEIVAGERRYRAAKAAGREFVPAIVREMTDAEVMQIQLVENLQRADLHPMEEAEAYQILLAGGTTVEEIAKRTGKATSYIAQRLKLLSLEIDARKIFAAGHMTIGHALLLARLTTRDQERALVYMLNLSDWDIKNGQSVSKAIATRVKEREKPYSGGAPQRVVGPTEAELRQWIDKNVLLVLDKAPWDIADSQLVPEAGPCTTCPKRSGANAALFSDITTREDVCMDPVCFATKQKAFVRLQQNNAKEAGTPLLKISEKSGFEKLDMPSVELRDGKAVVVAKKTLKQGQWVEAKKGECPATVQALWTDGKLTGKTRFVCAHQECKTHKHRVEQPKAKSISAAAVSGESWQEKQDREHKERRERAELEEKVRLAIGEQILAKGSQAARYLEMFVAAMINESGDVLEACKLLELKVPGNKKAASWEQAKVARPLLAKYLIEEATLTELRDVALQYLLGEALNVNTYNDVKVDRENMWALAKIAGVDAQATADRVERQAADAKKPQGKEVGDSKKPAKKAAAKKAVK